MSFRPTIVSISTSRRRPKWAAVATAPTPSSSSPPGTACFHSALRLVARRAGVDPGESTVTAEVGIGPQGGAYGLVVTLIVHLPGLDREKAREIAEAAHQVCPLLAGHPRQHQRRAARAVTGPGGLPGVARPVTRPLLCVDPGRLKVLGFRATGWQVGTADLLVPFMFILWQATTEVPADSEALALGVRVSGRRRCRRPGPNLISSAGSRPRS